MDGIDPSCAVEIRAAANGIAARNGRVVARFVPTSYTSTLRAFFTTGIRSDGLADRVAFVARYSCPRSPGIRSVSVTRLSTPTVININSAAPTGSVKLPKAIWISRLNVVPVD